MKSSKTDLIIVASATAKPGRERDLETALHEAAGPTREQPGCVQFSLRRDKNAPGTIVGFERWTSEAAHHKHLQGAHIQKLMARMGDILAAPPSIKSYEILDE